MAAPSSGTITLAYSTSTAPYTGMGIWTVTAPWGKYYHHDLSVALEQVCEKAGTTYGGRMAAWLSATTTSSAEVGTP